MRDHSGYLFLKNKTKFVSHSQNSSQSSLDDSFDHTDGSGTLSLQDPLPRGGMFKVLLYIVLICKVVDLLLNYFNKYLQTYFFRSQRQNVMLVSD